jgi:hypothetical protein
MVSKTLVERVMEKWYSWALWQRFVWSIAAMLLGLSVVVITWIAGEGDLGIMQQPQAAYAVVAGNAGAGILVALALVNDGLGYYLMYLPIVMQSGVWVKNQNPKVGVVWSFFGTLYCINGALGAFIFAWGVLEATYSAYSNTGLMIFTKYFNGVAVMAWGTVGALLGGLYWIFLGLTIVRLLFFSVLHQKPRRYRVIMGLFGLSSLVLGSCYILNGRVMKALVPVLEPYGLYFSLVYLLGALVFACVQVVVLRERRD